MQVDLKIPDINIESERGVRGDEGGGAVEPRVVHVLGVAQSRVEMQRIERSQGPKRIDAKLVGVSTSSGSTAALLPPPERLTLSTYSVRSDASTLNRTGPAFTL